MRRSWRWSVRLGGAAFVLLAVTVGLVAPAQAAAPQLFPTVRISPSSGPPGTAVTVRGAGFDPRLCGGAAGVRWRGAGLLAVQHVRLRADGTFSTTVRAPARGLLGTRAGRVVTSCGPGIIGLPGPRAWFRLTPAVAERPEPKPARPTTRPTTRPTPRPDRPDRERAERPARRAADEGRRTAVAGVSDRTGGGASAATPQPVREPAEIAVTPPATAPTTSSPAPSPSAVVTPSPAAATVTGAPAVAAARGDPIGVEPVRPALVTASVPTPDQIRFSPELMALAAALAALFVVLVAFPAELFNSTYDANSAEIRALLRHPARRFLRAAGVEHARSFGLVLAGFVGVSTLLTVVLAGNEAAGGNWPAQIVGLLVAITVVTLVAELPEELSARRFSGGVAGRLQVLPVAVLVAVACTLLSRVLGLQPAYMYGLFAGYAVAARPLSVRQEGRAVLTGIGTVAGFGLLCWLVWGQVHPAAYDGSAGWPTVLADAVLFWCFVLATEGLVFALLPLAFLDGSTLKAWNPLAWLLPQIAATVFFVYVFVLQGGTDDVTAGQVLRAAIFFAVFGILSVAFWAYFRWEGRPSHAMVADLGRSS